jgi:4'-phosphopantetheinyl transferase
MDDDWLSSVEQDYVSRLRFSKRRSEWRVARWTAKCALARALGMEADAETLRRIEVRASLEPDTRGAPFALLDGERLDTAVSLTDRAGWAVCAVGRRGPIGCDLELDEPRSPAFVRDYLTASEQRVVAAPPVGLTPDATANLLWSAKESALKVLRTGLRRDTRSVEVVLGHDDPSDGWRPLVVLDQEDGRSFPGWWQRCSTSFLLTVTASYDLPPPCALDEPPALTRATPTHSWMEAPLAHRASPTTTGR